MFVQWSMFGLSSIPREETNLARAERRHIAEGLLVQEKRLDLVENVTKQMVAFIDEASATIQKIDLR